MIDVLPTVLDLVGLPMPDVVQGQSLAPLLLGNGGWEPRPVILAMRETAGTETGRFECGWSPAASGQLNPQLQISQVGLSR